MPLTPVQIKDKLTNALDDDKNVIDEKAVEEVLTLLEASTITKEILEQTRLGRDINHVRKICRNAAIAKRARNLVKAWKQLIPVPGSPQVLNGQHPAQRISPGLTPSSRGLPSPALGMRQPQLKAGPCSPAIQGRIGQLSLPTSKLAQETKSRPGEVVQSPKIGQLQKSASTAFEDSNLSWPRTPPSVASDNSSDRLTGDSKIQDSSPADRNSQTSTGKRNFNFDSRSSISSIEATSKAVNRASDQRDVSKTNVANRKRTRSGISEDSSDLLSQPPSKQPHRVSSSSSLSTFGKNDVINGSVIRKMGVKSPGFSASHAGFSSVPSPKTAVSSSLSKSTLQDHSDACLLPNRINQRLNSLRQDSTDSRLASDTKGSREKLNKVKTTEQLIEDMQKKSATSVGTKVIAQIRTNQIEKEPDTLRVSLPRGVTGRGRNKKNLELLDAETRSEGGRLAQAKSEYIERFLQTSVAPTPGEDAFEQNLSHLCQDSLEEQPLSLAGCSSSFVQSVYNSRQDKPDSGPSASPPETRDILEGPGHLPSTSATALDDSSSTALDHLTEEQILSRLPPIDFDNIDWTSHDYPCPQPVQVNDALVDRLHHGNLEGINGNYDRDGQFRRWQEMLTVDSVSIEPLYVLPYVVLD
ncbi:unnamed protein product [Candidula unifasciata]|uniref:Mediator of RNA polymerase II transcription subunit 26 n=1 Tax=Candidula unifasciata TaxID=100452 RepID=A0A8S3Z0K7_9EUPU|nr:unnamed protein product [Candidula unifasciata]